MYKCEKCQTLVAPNIKSHRVVIETRTQTYPYRRYANEYKEDGKIKHSHDYGGVGYEAVREITVCPDCAESLRL